MTTDPAMWVINGVLQDYIAKHDIEQNIRNEDFLQSKQVYGDRTYCYLPAHLFERCLLNGKQTTSEYLV
jgi:hypothetical protein